MQAAAGGASESWTDPSQQGRRAPSQGWPFRSDGLAVPAD